MDTKKLPWRFDKFVNPILLATTGVLFVVMGALTEEVGGVGWIVLGVLLLLSVSIQLIALYKKKAASNQSRDS